MIYGSFVVGTLALVGVIWLCIQQYHERAHEKAITWGTLCPKQGDDLVQFCRSVDAQWQETFAVENMLQEIAIDGIKRCDDHKMAHAAVCLVLLELHRRKMETQEAEAKVKQATEHVSAIKENG